MSLSKYESEVKRLALSQEEAYTRFSDLRNLGALKTTLDNPEIQGKAAEHLSPEKMDEARQQLESMTFTEDCVTLSTPVGEITFRIVERDVPKLLKFAGEGSPMPLNLWIQLLPSEDGGSLLRVTVGAEVNMFMKTIVAKPLQQAADKLADILSVIR